MGLSRGNAICPFIPGLVWSLCAVAIFSTYFLQNICIFNNQALPFPSAGGRGGGRGEEENPSTLALHPKQQQLEDQLSEPLSSLDDLTKSSYSTCPNQELSYIENIPMDDVTLVRIKNLSARSIPPIIHQTSKTRCVTPRFLQAVQQWKDLNWTYYFHDDDAVLRLLRSDYFPEFPHLEAIVNSCALKGTLLSDLWRYVVLWKYGGIYVDIDSKPGIKFRPDLILQDDRDGFFVVDAWAVLSQFFMAVSPRHPLMYYAVQDTLAGLLQAPDTGSVRPLKVTGPLALHRAMITFRADAGHFMPQADKKPVRENLYVGTSNRSLMCVGRAEANDEYVVPSTIGLRRKMKLYGEMNMTHYMESQFVASGRSCMKSLLDNYWQRNKGGDGGGLPSR